MHVRVRQGVFRGRYLAMALGVLGIPFLIFGVWGYSHEKKRWENSTEGSGGMPKSPLMLLVTGIVAILSGIVAVLRSGNDD